MKKLFFYLLVSIPLLCSSQQIGIYPQVTASGTDTYTASYSGITPAPTAFVTGARYQVKFTNANTSTTPTLTFGFGAKTLKTSSGGALTASMIAAGDIKILTYDGTALRLLTGSVAAGGGGSSTPFSYVFSSSVPPNTYVDWVDIGNAYAGMYPIRRYINGAWQSVSPELDYYDPIGGVISRGRPFCVLAWGQSNLSSVSYQDYVLPGTGDRSRNNNITLWNADANVWTVPDVVGNPITPGGTTDNWSWELYYSGSLLPGPGQLQVFCQRFVKETGRSVRVVQWRVGGTGLSFWEPGGAGGGGQGYLDLVAKATASGVPYFDMIYGAQGEGGLTDASHTSLYPTYYESLYKGIMAGLRAQSFCDRKTAFIMTSPSNSVWSDKGFGLGIKSLSWGNNPYNAWAGNSATYKRVQIPNPINVGYATTSTTSVNLSTVSSGVTLNIGIGSSFPSGASQVAVVSRANPSVDFFIGAAAYNSGTGVLTVTTDASYNAGFYVHPGASGAHTDWDILFQDPLHQTVIEHLRNGEAIYSAYQSIVHSKGLKNIPSYQVADDDKGVINKYEINHPESADFRENYGTQTVNVGTIRRQYFNGASLPSVVEYYPTLGGSAAMSKQIWVSAGATATASDINIGFESSRNYVAKPLVFRQDVTAGANTTLIKMSSDGNYWMEYQSAVTGFLSGRHRFYSGTTELFDIYHAGGSIYAQALGNFYAGGDVVPTSTIHSGGSFATGYVAKTGAYTLTSSDHTVEVTSGTHTQTLPTAVGITGRQYTITNTGSGTVTIGTTSSQTFINVSGTPTTQTLTQFQTATVVSNGANWLRVH